CALIGSHPWLRPLVDDCIAHSGRNRASLWAWPRALSGPKLLATLLRHAAAQRRGKRLSAGRRPSGPPGRSLPAGPWLFAPPGRSGSSGSVALRTSREKELQVSIDSRHSSASRSPCHSVTPQPYRAEPQQVTLSPRHLIGRSRGRLLRARCVVRPRPLG